LPVKNTFIDVPSGLTPANMRVEIKQQPLMTAPPDLNRAPGFMQRAIASSVVAPSQILPPQSPLASSVQPPSGYGTRFTQTPLATASPSAAVGFSQTRFTQTPLATASPTAAMGFSQWRASTASTVPMQAPGQPVAADPVRYIYPSGVALPVQTVGMASQPAQLEVRTSMPAGYGSTLPAPVPEQGQDQDDDDDDSDGDILPPHLRNLEDAPQPPPGALHPSMGSEGHDEGTCKRCCFFPRGRCTNGYNCEFCHYEHEKRKRKNKKKKKKDGASSAAAAPSAAPILQPLQTAPTAMVSMQPSQAVQQAPPQQLQLPPQVLQQPVQPAAFMAYPPSPERSAQQPVLGTPGPYSTMPPGQLAAPQAPPQHHVIYGPTHGSSPGGGQPQALQAFVMPQPQPVLPPQQMQQQPQTNSPQHFQTLQTQPIPQPQHQAQPIPQPPSQVFAPPPLHIPMMSQVVEATPPPPMQSPKLGQAGAQPTMMPPPVSSPKMQRPMMPAVAGMQPK